MSDITVKSEEDLEMDTSVQDSEKNDSDELMYCFCQSKWDPHGNPMLQCSNESECRGATGGWIHWTCIDPKPVIQFEEVTDDHLWFCKACELMKVVSNVVRPQLMTGAKTIIDLSVPVPRYRTRSMKARGRKLVGAPDKATDSKAPVLTEDPAIDLSSETPPPSKSKVTKRKGKVMLVHLRVSSGCPSVFKTVPTLLSIDRMSNEGLEEFNEKVMRRAESDFGILAGHASAHLRLGLCGEDLKLNVKQKSELVPSKINDNVFNLIRWGKDQLHLVVLDADCPHLACRNALRRLIQEEPDTTTGTKSSVSKRAGKRKSPDGTAMYDDEDEDKAVEDDMLRKVLMASFDTDVLSKKSISQQLKDPETAQKLAKSILQVQGRQKVVQSLLPAPPPKRMKNNHGQPVVVDSRLASLPLATQLGVQHISARGPPIGEGTAGHGHGHENADQPPDFTTEELAMFAKLKKFLSL